MKLSMRLALVYTRTKIKLLSAISKKKAAAYAFRLFCTPPRRHRPSLPASFEDADKLSFTINNVSIHGWRWNHPSSRKILIIHGFESAAVNFDRYAKLLVQKGYEVLAFDAPAHGYSGGKTITAPLYAEMIRQATSRWGPVHGYLAHSFGGLALSLALETMPHQPDDKVVLIAPATETATAISQFFNLLHIPPGLRQAFEDCIVEAGGAPSSWYSVSRAIGSINSRVLWIHDEHDETTPLADAEKVRAANHPHIDFVITHGLGHRRIYRDQAVVDRVTEFL